MTAATLLAGALAGGADGLSSRDCLLCLAYLYSGGNTATVQLSAAIAAGCDRLSDGDIERCLAAILNAGAVPTPTLPVNLIPDGSVYIRDHFTLVFLNSPSNILQANTTYQVTFGTNEVSLVNGGGSPATLAAPGTYSFTTGDMNINEVLLITGNLFSPVTATIYAV